MIKSYPRVFKSATRLVIIYRNRVENYNLDNKESKKDIDQQNGDDVSYEYENIYGKGWNASHEIDIMRGNGFREVKIGKDDEVLQ